MPEVSLPQRRYGQCPLWQVPWTVPIVASAVDSAHHGKCRGQCPSWQVPWTSEWALQDLPAMHAGQRSGRSSLRTCSLLAAKHHCACAFQSGFEFKGVFRVQRPSALKQLTVWVHAVLGSVPQRQLALPSDSHTFNTLIDAARHTTETNTQRQHSTPAPWLLLRAPGRCHTPCCVDKGTQPHFSHVK